MDSFWGAEGPAALYVDLNGIYDLSSIQVIPYFSDDRCYNYEIYTSLDGRDYTLYGEKKDETPQTRQGETYTKDQEAVRSVMISMLSNSKNPSVHLNEVRIMGKLNTSATPPEDEDENNLALNCPVYVSSQQDGMNKASLTNGDNHTAWAPKFNPAYAQIDLEQNVKISSIQVIPPVTMGSEEYAQYSVYASLDGKTYDLVGQKNDTKPSPTAGESYAAKGKEARYIRILTEYCSTQDTLPISEVRVYGEESETELQSPSKNVRRVV